MESKLSLLSEIYLRKKRCDSHIEKTILDICGLVKGD